MVEHGWAAGARGCAALPVGEEGLELVAEVLPFGEAVQFLLGEIKDVLNVSRRAIGAATLVMSSVMRLRSFAGASAGTPRMLYTGPWESAMNSCVSTNAFTTISPMRETGWKPSTSLRFACGSEGPKLDW